MTPKQHEILVTPDVIIARLKSSITQVSDLRLELTTLGLDQVRHQPTPLQNQLLAAACTSLEAWVEIQKTKLERAESVDRVLGGGEIPKGICPWNREGKELFVSLDPCFIRTDGIQLGPQNPPTPEIS